MEIDGKSLAVLLMGKAENGEEDWAVFPGTVRRRGDAHYLDRGADRNRFVIRQEWLSQIKSVADDLRDVLQDCELYLPLSFGSLPAECDSAEFELTGLQWPNDS